MNGDVIMIGRLTTVAVTLLKLAVAVKDAMAVVAWPGIAASIPVCLDRKMARLG